MIRVEVASQEEAEFIVKHPSVYGRVTDDSSPEAEVLEFPHLNVALAGYVGNKIASLYVVDPFTREMHFMVLDSFRGHARKLLEKSFNYYGKSVHCIIPLYYHDVIKFAINSGFKIVNMVDNYRLIQGMYFKGVILERME